MLQTSISYDYKATYPGDSAFYKVDFCPVFSVDKLCDIACTDFKQLVSSSVPNTPATMQCVENCMPAYANNDKFCQADDTSSCVGSWKFEQIGSTQKITCDDTCVLFDGPTRECVAISGSSDYALQCRSPNYYIYEADGRHKCEASCVGKQLRNVSTNTMYLCKAGCADKVATIHSPITDEDETFCFAACPAGRVTRDASNVCELGTCGSLNLFSNAGQCVTECPLSPPLATATGVCGDTCATFVEQYGITVAAYADRQTLKCVSDCVNRMAFFHTFGASTYKLCTNTTQNSASAKRLAAAKCYDTTSQLTIFI